MAAHNLSSTHKKQRFREEFERLYFLHAEALIRYGTKFQANRELVEDCVQELFADFWEQRNTWSAITSVRPYLLGALRRKLLRRIYSQREHVLDAENAFDFYGQLSSTDWSEDSTQADEAQLTAALQHLTTKQQEVLYLRFYNQLSTKEIAEIMSVRPRTVYKLTRRAIMALQARLTPAPPVVEALMALVFFYFM